MDDDDEEDDGDDDDVTSLWGAGPHNAPGPSRKGEKGAVHTAGPFRGKALLQGL